MATSVFQRPKTVVKVYRADESLSLLLITNNIYIGHSQTLQNIQIRKTSKEKAFIEDKQKQHYSRCAAVCYDYVVGSQSARFCKPSSRYLEMLCVGSLELSILACESLFLPHRPLNSLQQYHAV